MTFHAFLDEAWNDHGTRASEVADRIGEGLNLIEKPDQIPPMAHLVTHVFGEHLGDWDRGIQALEQMRDLPVYESDSESEGAIRRSIASLELGAGKRQSVSDLSRSDQIRVLAVTGAAMCEQKDLPRAEAFFRQALELAQSGLVKGDPANRALAVTAHNLACTLEDKPTLNETETRLMILAAQTSRQFWGIAGTWLQVQRAEYRLSQTFLKAGEPQQALEHALACVHIAREHQAPAVELFFGYEALALTEKARGNLFGLQSSLEQMKLLFEQLLDEEKRWCSPTLAKVTKLVSTLLE